MEQRSNLFKKRFISHVKSTAPFTDEELQICVKVLRTFEKDPDLLEGAHLKPLRTAGRKGLR